MTIQKPLTLKQVSEATGIPAGTLRYYRHCGNKGPRSYKLGRAVVYDEEDVAEWLDEQRDAGHQGSAT